MTNFCQISSKSDGFCLSYRGNKQIYMNLKAWCFWLEGKSKRKVNWSGVQVLWDLPGNSLFPLMGNSLKLREKVRKVREILGLISRKKKIILDQSYTTKIYIFLLTFIMHFHIFTTIYDIGYIMIQHQEQTMVYINFFCFTYCKQLKDTLTLFVVPVPIPCLCVCVRLACVWEALP